jgi:two-component system nitrogen regulation response regulator NtrX
MSATAQAKVLRVIQEQKFERVGGEKTLDIDVRILAATNKNLEEECAAGRFRQDLFFRLNVIPIRLPPLRERTDDIPVLLKYFLSEAGEEQYDFDEAALRALKTYNWPGNIRELRNLAERLRVMYQGCRIGEELVMDLLQKVPRAFGTQGAEEKNSPLPSPGTGAHFPPDLLNMHFNEARELFEKSYLEFQLSQNNGIISRTAEAIGIYPSNLHAKLRKYGIRTDR